MNIYAQKLDEFKAKRDNLIKQIYEQYHNGLIALGDEIKADYAQAIQKFNLVEFQLVDGWGDNLTAKIYINNYISLLDKYDYDEFLDELKSLTYGVDYLFGNEDAHLSMVLYGDMLNGLDKSTTDWG